MANTALRSGILPHGKLCMNWEKVTTVFLGLLTASGWPAHKWETMKFLFQCGMLRRIRFNFSVATRRQCGRLPGARIANCLLQREGIGPFAFGSRQPAPRFVC